MQNVHTWQVLVTTANLVLSAVCFVIASAQSPSHEQKLMQSVTFFLVLLFLGYWGTASVTEANREFLIFTTKMQYFAGCNILLFILILYARLFAAALPVWLIAVLSAWSLFLTALTMTFDLHTWYYSAFNVIAENGIWTLKKEYAWGHTLFFATIIVYIALYAALFVQKRSKTTRQRIDKCVLLGMVIIPAICWLAEAMSRRRGESLAISLVPEGALISEICLIIMLLVRRFCDITQLANNQICASTKDAIIVTDLDHRITEMNPAARTIFPMLADDFDSGHGTLSDDYLPLLSDTADEYTEIDNQHYRPSVSRVMYKGAYRGYIYTLYNHSAEYRYIHELDKKVAEKTSRISKMQENMIMAVSILLEGMSHYTSEHLRRTSAYTGIIAESLRRQNVYADTLTDEYINTLRQVAPLHDIGKFYVDPNLLNSDRHLSPEEQDDIKKHTAEGAAIIRKIMPEAFDPMQLRLAEEVTLYHHERWDGSGYHEHRKGQDIPLSARIMAVSDVFDALSSERPYKKAFTLEQAFEVIGTGRGTQFDPAVVDALFAAQKEIETAYRNSNHS